MKKNYPFYCDLTFQAEGAHLDVVLSPHWPGSTSGVTLGPGYDLGGRTATEIIRDLTTCGVPKSAAEIMGTAQGLKGDVAARWVAENKSKVTITRDSVVGIFNLIYPQYVAMASDVVKKWGGKFESFSQPMQEVLVDLRYRGDLGDKHKAVLEDPIRAGDFNGFRRAIGDLEYWQRTCNLPLTNGKPNKRFSDRARWLDRDSSRVCLPVKIGSDDSKSETFVSLLEHTERNQIGGYYPLGLFQNLHGGVHIESRGLPGSARVPVRCLLPGRIVAIRMPQALPGSSAEALAAAKEGARRSKIVSGNYNAFVLVRHELSKPSESASGGPTEPPMILYSLYFHLASPDWNRPGEEYGNVPWVNVLARVNGSVTVIDPTRPDFNRPQWLAGPPPDQEALVLSRTVDCFGATVARVNPFSFAPRPSEPECKAIAIWRPTNSDIKKIHDQLAAGKVLTFDYPLLPVDRGDILGYLDPHSPAGVGFIHWELLCPAKKGAQSDIERLVGLADTALSLDGLLKRYEEKKDHCNNYFEASEKELDALVDDLKKRLPEAKQGLVEDFRDGYCGNDVVRSEQADGLPFFDGQAPEQGFTTPITLKLENHRELLPGRDYSVRIRCEPSGEERTVTVAMGSQSGEGSTTVPADTKAIVVESDDFNVDLGPAPSVLEDAGQIKRFLGARFRNFWLRHLNEWSPDGMKTTISAHLADYRMQRDEESTSEASEMPSDAELKAYCDATAWWASPSCVAAPHSDGKAGTALFGSDELPKETLIDNLHPVIGAWLLELLLKHGKLVCAPVQQAQRSGSGSKHYVGWMPSYSAQPQRRVGENVFAVAVWSDFDDLQELQIYLTGREELLVAQGKPAGGILAQLVPLSCWGQWELDLKPKPRKTIGDVKVKLPPPRPAIPPAGKLQGTNTITGLPAPTVANGKYSWTLRFDENCPVELYGYVFIEAAMCAAGQAPKPADFKRQTLGIPVVARGVAAVRSKSVLFSQGLLVKGPASASERLTDHFTFDQYYKAAKLKDYRPGSRLPKLTRALVEAAEDVCVRAGCATLSLAKLSDDGLGVDLSGASAAALLDACDKARQGGRTGLQAQAARDKQGNPACPVTIRVPAASSSTTAGIGDMIVEVDPSAALASLGDACPVDKEASVRLGLIFPNGGPFVRFRSGGSSDPVPGPGSGCIRGFDYDEVAKHEPIIFESEAVATTVAASPRIGKPQFSVSQHYLVVTALLLGGSKKFWSEANPKLELSGVKGKLGSVEELKGPDGTLVGLVVRAQVDMTAPGVANKDVVATAKPAKASVKFANRAITVNPVSSDSFSNRPTAELELVLDDLIAPYSVGLRARLHAVRADEPLVFQIADPRGAAVLVPITYENPGKPQKGLATGKCNARFELEARCLTQDLYTASPGSTTFTVQLAVAKNNGQKIGKPKPLAMPLWSPQLMNHPPASRP